MANMRSKHGLEINDDPSSQKRKAVGRRTAWVVMGILLIAAFFGLFGSGPLSDASATEGGVRVQYERFARRQAQTELQVRVDGAAIRDGVAEVRLSRASASHVDVLDVRPRP